MTDKEIINVGDMGLYFYDNDNKSISVVEVVKNLSVDVVVVKFLQVFVDDSGNGFFDYLHRAEKTMNVSRKYLHKIDLVDRQQAEIERLKIENQSLRSAANSFKLHYNEARAEGYIDGIKDFVNTLNEDARKEFSEFHSFYPLFDNYNIFFTKLHIDKRAEEMIRGDTK